MSVCQSQFPVKNRTSLSQFEIMKKRLTPANSFRSVRSRDQLEHELHKDLQRRLSLQFEIRKRSQFYQSLMVPDAHHGRKSPSYEQGSDTHSAKLSPSMESINSVESQTLSTFSSHSVNAYGSCPSVGENTAQGKDCIKSPSLHPVKNSVCTSDSTIYQVISKPKKHRTSLKNQTRYSEVCKKEEVCVNSNIYSEVNDRYKSLPNRNLVGRQTSAPGGYVYPPYISANHCPPEATLELEADHIYVCIERYIPCTPDELALEKGDIVEGLSPLEHVFEFLFFFPFQLYIYSSTSYFVFLFIPAFINCILIIVIKFVIYPLFCSSLCWFLYMHQVVCILLAVTSIDLSGIHVHVYQYTYHYMYDMLTRSRQYMLLWQIPDIIHLLQHGVYAQ